MLQKYIKKYFFCGYEYKWRCTDYAGSTFEVITKDISTEYGYWINASNDYEKFLKHSAPHGKRHVKVISVEFVIKKPFKEFLGQTINWKLFGKAVDNELLYGPAEKVYN